jgi:hypothetical protein
MSPKIGATTAFRSGGLKVALEQSQQSGSAVTHLEGGRGSDWAPPEYRREIQPRLLGLRFDPGSSLAGHGVDPRHS